jgi:hypothetical protein
MLQVLYSGETLAISGSVLMDDRTGFTWWKTQPADRPIC